jgi:hypothetical protein
MGKTPPLYLILTGSVALLLLALTLHPRSPVSIPNAIRTPQQISYLGKSPPPFAFDETRYPPPPSPFQEKPHHEPTFDFEISPTKEPGMSVPNSVHFIWMPSGPPVEDEEVIQKSEFLPYSAYLSIRSALLILKPDRLLPHGPWFEKLKPNLTLNNVPSPVRVYDHTLMNPANRADVLRILALQKLGGIYLDLDMYMYVPSIQLLKIQNKTI